MFPSFYGGTGKMEAYYGERKAFRFTDKDNRPIANKVVTLTMPQGGIVQKEITNSDGVAFFDLLSSRHFQFGNSLENGGVKGTPERVDYQSYIFSASGLNSYTLIPANP
jgi:hypothetical protein